MSKLKSRGTRREQDDEKGRRKGSTRRRRRKGSLFRRFNRFRSERLFSGLEAKRQTMGQTETMAELEDFPCVRFHMHMCMHKG